MKRHLVAFLVRLYPSRWRSEYGSELADLLQRRPLTGLQLLNVLANALWQQCRTGEPWILLGVPFTVPALIACIQVAMGVPFAEPHARVDVWVSVEQAALYFAAGFWTMRRRGERAGRAAIKVNFLAAAPLMLLGLLGVAGAVEMPRYWQGMLTFGPAIQVPFAALIGWIGGRAARICRRPRRETTV